MSDLNDGGKDDGEGYAVNIPETILKEAEQSVDRIKATSQDAGNVLVEASAPEAVAPPPPAAPHSDHEAKITELRDKLLRTLADFDNFKKRTRKEKEEYVRHSNEMLLKEILPVADNMALALSSMSGQASIGAVIKGVELVLRQVQDLLGKHGVKRFESKGTRFDPACHDAVELRKLEGAEPGIVVEEIKPGYMISDRLLRPALVAVSRAPEREAAKDPGGPEEKEAGWEPPEKAAER